MVEVISDFERREGLRPGGFLRMWADARGQELYRRLEIGEIDQRGWNEGFGALLNISAENLMGRVLYTLDPAYEVLNVARDARRAGIRTAVLSNSLGTDPHDPYFPYRLEEVFDVVVMSTDLRIRKPDPAIFRHTLDMLGVTPSACVFADDTETNLEAAEALGIFVVHAVDEDETASQLRELLDASSAQ